jgi:hypothetical protein
VASIVAALGAAGRASAGNMIIAEPMFGEKVRIDGDLREWPAKMTELGDVVSGKPSSGDPSASVVIGYDETTLFVVVKVKDGKLARTAGAGSNEDHATLYLSFPKGATHEVDLYPGAPGKSGGLVKKGGSAVSGA